MTTDTRIAGEFARLKKIEKEAESFAGYFTKRSVPWRIYQHWNFHAASSLDGHAGSMTPAREPGMDDHRTEGHVHWATRARHRRIV
jgi:hypothetical protein